MPPPVASSNKPTPVVASSNSPSKSGDPKLRKNILKRVNERYSTDYEEDTEDDDKPTLPIAADAARPLPVAPTQQLHPSAAAAVTRLFQNIASPEYS